MFCTLYILFNFTLYIHTFKHFVWDFGIVQMTFIQQAICRLSPIDSPINLSANSHQQFKAVDYIICTLLSDPICIQCTRIVLFIALWDLVYNLQAIISIDTIYDIVQNHLIGLLTVNRWFGNVYKATTQKKSDKNQKHEWNLRMETWVPQALLCLGQSLFCMYLCTISELFFY